MTEDPRLARWRAGSRRCRRGSSQRWRRSRKNSPALRRRARLAASRSSRGLGPTRAARRVAADAWRCCTGGCSKRWGRIARQFSAPFRRNSPAKFPARAEDPRFWAAGRLRHRPSVEPPRADGAHECEARAHHKNVVRRRRRLDADAGRSSLAERSRRDRRSTLRCAPPATVTRGSPTRSASRPGATTISFSSTATSRAESAAFSSTGSTAPATPAIRPSKPTSPWCATSATASSRSIRRSCGGTRRRPGAEPSARNN